MTPRIRRVLKIALPLFAAFLLILAEVLYLYSRPVDRQYQVILAFDPSSTSEQRSAALALLRARVKALADPAWHAQLFPQPEASVLLIYNRSGGPGDLAESILPRAVCEFRFLDSDPNRLQSALKNGPPPGFELVNYFETCDGYDVQSGEPIRRLYPRLVEKTPALVPRPFQDIRFWTEGFIKRSHVRFDFHPDDIPALAKLSEAHPDRTLALAVDGFLRIALSVGPKPEGGAIEIEALLDNAEIDKLVTLIRNGPLPCAVRIARRSAVTVQ